MHCLTTGLAARTDPTLHMLRRSLHGKAAALAGFLRYHRMSAEPRTSLT